MIKIEQMWEFVMAVMLAMAGGFARLLNLKDKTRMKCPNINDAPSFVSALIDVGGV